MSDEIPHPSTEWIKEFIAKAKIMIVDDTPENLQILGSLLREKGYQVIPAVNGSSALKIMNTLVPDLILLDIMMPLMDGFEVLRQMRLIPALREVPVIFLTAKVEAEDVVRGFQNGAVDYVTKPFESTELLARVQTHLRLRASTVLLETKNQQLLSLNQEKSAFMRMAAHDLKNPLSIIQLIVELAIASHRNSIPAELTTRLFSIQSNVRRMLGIIQNVLGLEAIDQGLLKLNMETINLSPEVSSCLANFNDLAKSKNLQFELFLPPEPCFAVVDKQALNQILDNLVSNAMKFSPPEKNITVRIVSTQEQHEICIQDAGPGITEDDRKHMFKKFAKLSARPTGGETSNGLGLSIAKKLVDLQHGFIRCESTPGQGACFIISFKRASENTPR